MNKAAWLAILLLLALGRGVFAEVGFGLSLGYLLTRPESILAGVNVRWKPSIIFFDAGLYYPLDGGVSYGYLDLGLCFDWRFLRFGLAAGLDRVGNEEENGADSEDGLNVKANLDFLLGRASVGLSGSSSQLSVNLFYWLGSRSRRR